MMEKNAKIYVAGHRGLVGSAIWENLERKGYENLVGRTHKSWTYWMASLSSAFLMRNSRST